MKHCRFPLLALVAFPLLLAGCEQKPAPAPATAPAPEAAAPAAQPAGPGTGVRFELVEPAPVGALQFDVAYKGEGRFVGDADAVACETRLEGALSSYNHIVGDKLLRAAFVAIKGFSGPVTICECKFQGEVKAEDFTVTVRDSSTPDLQEMDPAPTVKAVVD